MKKRKAPGKGDTHSNAAELAAKRKQLTEELAALHAAEADYKRIGAENKAKKKAKKKANAARIQKEEEVAKDNARKAEVAAKTKEDKAEGVRRKHAEAKAASKVAKAEKHEVSKRAKRLMKEKKHKSREARKQLSFSAAASAGSSVEEKAVILQTPPHRQRDNDGALSPRLELRPTPPPLSGDEDSDGEHMPASGNSDPERPDAGEEEEPPRCRGNLGNPSGPSMAVNGGCSVHTSITVPAVFTGTGSLQIDGVRAVFPVPSSYVVPYEMRQKLKHMAETRVDEDTVGILHQPAEMDPDPTPANGGWDEEGEKVQVKSYAAHMGVLVGGSVVETQPDSYNAALAIGEMFKGQPLIHLGKTPNGSLFLPVPIRPALGYNTVTQQWDAMSEADMSDSDKEARKRRYLADVAAIKSGIVDVITQLGGESYASTSAATATRTGSTRVSALATKTSKVSIVHMLMAVASYQCPDGMPPNMLRRVWVSCAGMKAPTDDGDLLETMVQAAHQLEMVTHQTLTQTLGDFNGETEFAKMYKVNVDLRQQLQTPPTMRPLVSMHGFGSGEHASEERATQMADDGAGVADTCGTCGHPVDAGDNRGHGLFKAATVDTSHQSGPVRAFPIDVVDLACGCCAYVGGVTYSEGKLRCTGDNHEGSRVLGNSCVLSTQMVQAIAGMERPVDAGEGKDAPVEGGISLTAPSAEERPYIAVEKAAQVAAAVNKLKIYNGGDKHLTGASGVRDKPTDELAQGTYVGKVHAHTLAMAVAYDRVNTSTAYALLDATYRDVGVAPSLRMPFNGFQTLVHTIEQGNEYNTLVVEFSVNICDACRGNGETWYTPQELLLHKLDAAPLRKFLRGFRGHPTPMKALCVPTVSVPIVPRVQEMMQLLLAVLAKGKDGHGDPGQGNSALAALYKVKFTKAAKPEGKRAKGALAAYTALHSAASGVIGLHTQRTLLGKYSGGLKRMLRDLKGMLVERGLINVAEGECGAPNDMDEEVKMAIGAAALRRCDPALLLDSKTSSEGSGYYGNPGEEGAQPHSPQQQHPIIGDWSEAFVKGFPGSINYSDYLTTRRAETDVGKKGVTWEVLTSAVSLLTRKMASAEGGVFADMLAVLSGQMQFEVSHKNSMEIGKPHLMLGVKVGDSQPDIIVAACLEDARFLRQVERRRAGVVGQSKAPPKSNMCHAFLGQGSIHALEASLRERLGAGLCSECKAYLAAANNVVHTMNDDGTRSGLGMFPTLERLMKVVVQLGPFATHATEAEGIICLFHDTMDDDGEQVAAGLRIHIRSNPLKPGSRGRWSWGNNVRGLMDQCGTNELNIRAASNADVKFTYNQPPDTTNEGMARNAKQARDAEEHDAVMETLNKQGQEGWRAPKGHSKRTLRGANGEKGGEGGGSSSASSSSNARPTHPPVVFHPQASQIKGARHSTSLYQGHGVDEAEALEIQTNLSLVAHSEEERMRRKRREQGRDLNSKAPWKHDRGGGDEGDPYDPRGGDNTEDEEELDFSAPVEDDKEETKESEEEEESGEEEEEDENEDEKEDKEEDGEEEDEEEGGAGLGKDSEEEDSAKDSEGGTTDSEYKEEAESSGSEDTGAAAKCKGKRPRSHSNPSPSAPATKASRHEGGKTAAKPPPRKPRHEWSKVQTRGVLQSLLHVTEAGSTDRPSATTVHTHLVGVMRGVWKPTVEQVFNKIKSLRKAYKSSALSAGDCVKYRSCLASKDELRDGE